MSDNIGIEIVTDRNVALRFDKFPDNARKALKAAITAKTEELRGLVEAAVPKRTGRLASEISSQVVEYPNRITGVVGITGGSAQDYAKAAAEEYGAHGTARVRAHTAKLGHIFDKLIEPMQVMRQAYDRHVNIQQREFLRGPLRTIEADALADMKAAVQTAIDA